MTRQDRYLTASVALALAALWPADRMTALLVLALAAAALRYSRDAA